MSRRLHLEALETREVPAAIAALDPSFDTDGKLSLTGSPFSGVALQSSGQIIAVGTSGGDFLVARYNPDGSLDTTFGTAGTRKLDFGGTDTAKAVAIDSSNRIIVVGSTTSGTNMAVARLTANGAPDNSFDTDGLLTIDFGGTGDAANAVAIDKAGNIVVAGTTGTNFAIARLTPAAGALDGAFDTDGKQTVDLLGTDIANGVAIQANGNIVVAGTTGTDFAVARLLGTNGSPDNTFDSDGKFAFDLGGVDVAHAVAIDANGNIVLAGNNGGDMVVIRLAGVNGAFDPSFDTDGKKFVDVSGADDARALQIQADGRILLIGDTANLASDTAIVRLTTAGALDTTFNGTGKFTTDVTGNGFLDLGTAAVLSPQGRLIIAGQGGGGFVNGFLVRVPVELEDSRNLAVGGSLNGIATLYVPNTATGQYNPVAAAAVAAFGNTSVNVRTAVGDVNGDGVEDTVLVTGPGTAIRVAVISGTDNSTVLISPFDPFGGNFTGGGFVSVGDFDNDGRADLVVTPDQGGGPRVSIFTLMADGKVHTRANFLGIDDSNFRGGARTAVGDVNADGFADLAVAAGFQGGPRVALFNGSTIFSNPTNRLVGDFLAFDASLRNGSYVSIGDVTGDGFADLYFGAGPGGAPRVLGVNGQALLSNTAAAFAAPLSSFFLGGNAENRGGVRVATTDMDGDGRADLIAGTGEGMASFVRTYAGSTITGIGEPAGFQDLNPFSSAVLANGVFVG
jgi:uncharacterized delta-60 repeat protein